MEHWYTLYTKPHAERRVCRELQARDIKTYLPMIAVWRVRRRQMEEEPLFANYLFARVDLERVGISAVAWTPGLRYIVGGESGLPAPVPNAVIAYIRQRVGGLGPQGPIAQLQPGDPVRITEGPFRDLEAAFEQHLSGYERAQVLIQVLGHLTRYDVTSEWLAPVGK